MRYIIRKTVLFLLCLAVAAMILPSSAARAEEAPLLRVLLRRLGITTRMDLHLEGAYMLRSGNTQLLLQRDTGLTVELREGQLVVFLPGVSAAMGTSLTLTRMDDGGETAPALRVGDGTGIYPGDLRLSVSEDNTIQPVLSIDMEDYLKGVVPNEMSDSFPLEALKTQAVCARTYAMRKMGRTGDWDVVDTTNDQVFRAIQASNKNAAKAVEETAGLVITYKGMLIEAWYSASNGGQTEIPSHVWSGTDYANCYAMKDDPWDEANPDSLTRSVELNRDGSGLYRRITGLLREAAFKDPLWAKSGFAKTEDAFRVDGFTAMRVKTPRYDSPSRLMTELEITMNVSGKKDPVESAEFESAGSVTVTLQIFPDVLDALGLRVSTAGNELMTVEETDTVFRLKTARFGHGVGLSQRGAQWMASHGGKHFDEIIDFYFPNTTIVRYTGETSPVPAPDPLIAETPEPIAVSVAVQPTLMPVTESDLPEGAYVASVENISDDSSLNLRSDPSPAASIVMRLYKHQHLIVLDELDVPGWAHVVTDTADGYVMTSYIEKVE